MEDDREPGKSLLHLDAKKMFRVRSYPLFQVTFVVSKGC